MKPWASLSALGLVVCGQMAQPVHAQEFERARGGSSGSPRVSIAAEPPPVSQLIIKYKEDPADQGRASSAEESAAKSHARAAAVSSQTGVGLTFRRAMSGRSEVFALPTKMSVAAAQALAAQIATDPAVEYAEPDYVMKAHASAPNDYRWGSQWPLSGVFSETYPAGVIPPVNVYVGSYITVLTAWNWTLGSGVVVGVVDGGVTSHPDLTPNLLPGYTFVSDPANSNDGLGRRPGGWDPGDYGVCDGVFKPSSWHGTHVAGIIAAASNDAFGVAGVAPQAKIVSARALGTCGVGPTSDIQDAIRWVAGLPVPGVPLNPNPAKVINVSIGSGVACSQSYRSAVSDVTSVGAVLVASNGNEASLVTTKNVASPAICPGVVAVAAHAAEGDITAYSNTGPETSLSAPGGGFGVRSVNGVLTRVGSGIEIFSDANAGTTSPTSASGAWKFGTSMAAPHVSGTAALLLARYPGLSPSRVKATLQASSWWFPSSTWCSSGTTEECGAGMLDAAQAMTVAARPVTSLVASVLPASRSVTVGQTATAFATVINAGSSTAYGCQIVSPPGLNADFFYQVTDPATNQPTPGYKNFPVSIAPGQFRSFVFALTPRGAFLPQDVTLKFNCATAPDAPAVSGLNTLLLSGSATPVPDIVALAATVGGDGIVNVPGTAGTGFFAVATVNVGVSSTITASASLGNSSLPASLFICQTNPGTGSCLAPPADSVATSISAGATPTFAIFARGSGFIPFDPANNRVSVIFRDGGGQVRGATSVAIRTQ